MQFFILNVFVKRAWRSLYYTVFDGFATSPFEAMNFRTFMASISSLILTNSKVVALILVLDVEGQVQFEQTPDDQHHGKTDSGITTRGVNLEKFKINITLHTCIGMSLDF